MDYDLEVIKERLGARGIIKNALKSVDYIFDSLFEKGEQWIISGAPKSGKSRLALQLALCASEGHDFLGHKCPQKQRVLYIDLELSPRLSASRIYEFYNRDSAALLSNSHFFICHDHKQIDVNSTSDCGQLQETISAINPDLIIWDVLARMHTADENSNIAMIQVMQNIRRLSRGAAHVIVHHARKEKFGNPGAKSLRGASSIHGEADGVMSLAAEKSKKGSHSLIFSTRAIETPEKLWLRNESLVFVKSEYEAEENNESPSDFLKRTFGSEKTLSKVELMKNMELATKLSTRQIERNLENLVRNGLLRKTKSGREVIFEIII